ncbi:MAG: hypothetical protein ACHQ16_01595 [Candidatus Lutacidiplasmatales archaeon]
MSGAPSVGPDSSHVPHIYRGVVYGRTALTWYLAYSLALVVVVALVVPFIGIWYYDSYQLLESEPGLVALIGAGLAVGVFVTLPLAIGTLLQWRRSFLALHREVPAASAWVPHVLVPIRRCWWIALGALVATVALIALLLGLSVWVTDAYGTNSYTADVVVANELGGAALAGLAAAQLATQALVVRSFALLIAGSEVPAIDRDLRRGHRIALLTSPAILVPPALLLVLSYFDSVVGPTIPWLSVIGLVSPVGLVAAVLWIRRAYSSWIGLAHRLVGKRDAV